MLRLDHKVPDALILPEPIAGLKEHLEKQGAHWFSARPDFVDQTDAGAATSMKSVTGEAIANRTRANKDNSRLIEGGLSFREATHCGFMLENLALDSNTWSCAVRFSAPENSARTLMTLNSTGTENYIFLQQVSGQMIFKDQKATLELTTDCNFSTVPNLVLAGMSNGRLWLRTGRGEVLQSDPGKLALDSPMTLFIGCRNNKGRLQKTLGEFTLLDLIFWPTLNILEPAEGETRDALNDDCLWRPEP